MRSRHYAVAIVLAVYTAWLLVALLAPSSATQSSLVVWLGGTLGDLGAPSWLVDYDRLEVVMNAVIIAPVTFLGSVLRPSYGWRDWTALGFAASLTVELVQAVLLPGRDGSFADVVANTSGALLGAVVFEAVGAVTSALSPSLADGRSKTS